MKPQKGCGTEARGSTREPILRLCANGRILRPWPVCAHRLSSAAISLLTRLLNRPPCTTGRSHRSHSMPAAHPLPQTLGELRTSTLFSEARLKTRSVKDEMRSNLIARLKTFEAIFPGIVGYEDTVVPQIVNAVLSKQNFILLGLRGQAKS